MKDYLLILLGVVAIIALGGCNNTLGASNPNITQGYYPGYGMFDHDCVGGKGSKGKGSC